jgi:hypothetical protein
VLLAGVRPGRNYEVQNGASFWTEPRQLDANEALRLLNGREPPVVI